MNPETQAIFQRVWSQADGNAPGGPLLRGLIRKEDVYAVAPPLDDDGKWYVLGRDPSDALTISSDCDGYYSGYILTSLWRCDY